MPDTEEQIIAKLDALKAIPSPQVAELVLVRWPGPDGPIYYGTRSAARREVLNSQTLLDQLEGNQTLELRFDKDYFLDVPSKAGISDESLPLDFWDGDNEITRLYHTHGAGEKVEVFYYFPEVDLLFREWWGHFQPPSEIAFERFKTAAEFGFRSSKLSCPSRGHYSSCSAIWGGLLETQAQIDENDCPWNLHIGGSTGVPGSELLPPCPRNSRATCKLYLPDDLSYMGDDTVIQSYVVNQTKGPNLMTTTRGNENNLKRARRVIFGDRYVADCDLLAYSVEPDTKHPEGGAVACVFEIGEGPIQGQSGQTINNTLVGYQHLQAFNGELRQGRNGLSKDAANHSGTALFFGRIQGDFTKTTAQDLRGEVQKVYGLRDVRVYTSETEFTKQYSQARAWCYARVLTDKRWGGGYDWNRVYIPDLLDLTEWGAEIVTVHDKDGNVTTGPRWGLFNAELIDRSFQQQSYDICLAGRMTEAFPDLFGVERIRPLKRLTDEELAAAPVFTDYPDDPTRNILVDDRGVTTLVLSEQDDKTLCNRALLTFDDAANQNSQIPLVFEPPDLEQQFAAGRAFGDNTRRAIEQEYTALGVTNVGEASRLGNLLLYLGPFDQGGLANNLRVQFTTWWSHAIQLLKYSVIRVKSKKLDFVNDIREAKGLERFEYFRIIEKPRRPDLKVEITAQAYPVAYYEKLEGDEAPAIPPSPIGVNPGGGFGALPFDVGFSELNHTGDRITFKLALVE